MKLKILAKKLSSLQLHKEASDVIKLKPLEHPDWKDEWEEPKDYSPEEIAPKGLYTGSVGTAVSNMNDVLANLNITIISGEEYEPLGSGAHGKVYHSIYNGKPSVAKIQFYPANLPIPFAHDVESWEKLMSIWDKVPDFVRKHIPEVFFAKEGEFTVTKLVLNPPVQYKYQIMVMEELRPISKKIKFSIEGDGWPGNKDSAWLWEEELENLYLEILEKFTEKSFDPPTRGEIKNIILEEIKSGESISSKLTKFLHKKLDYPVTTHDPDKIEVYFKLSDYIRDLSKRFSRSIPRWKQKHDLPRYVPPDVQSFSTAIDWLRDNGMSAGDILGDNVMIDRSGTLKIADIGCL
jgi:hypothetical protein